MQSCFSPSSFSASAFVDSSLTSLPRHPAGGRGAVGAGVLGALLPGNAGGGGPGLVHPVAWPQQPGYGAAAAAAQRPVRLRSPQQPGGSGGESKMAEPSTNDLKLTCELIRNTRMRSYSPLFMSFSAEEEHLESRSEGVRPGEEILGVPLTPMEPPHAHTQQSSHILRDSGGHDRAHTDSHTHTHAGTHTHTHTKIHLKSMACWQAQLGGGGISFSFFLSFCFFNLFISCLFLVNWGTFGNWGGGGV